MSKQRGNTLRAAVAAMAMAGLAILTGCGGSSSGTGTPGLPATATALAATTAGPYAVYTSVTLQATISPASSLSGAVTFYDGSTTIGTATVSGPVATLTTTFSTLGTHTLTATYGGSSTYAASTSPALAIGVIAVGVGGTLAAGGASSIYVIQQGSAASTVLQFSATATGSVSPISTLNLPAGTTGVSVATDMAGNIYVGTVITNTQQGLVVVYAVGATGSATPTRTILGGTYAAPGTATTFTKPVALAVGPANQLYVLSSASSSPSSYSVATMSPTATGAATPVSFLQGSSTQLGTANSMAVDSASNVYVSTLVGSGSGAILVFASGATGNVAPARVITNPQVFYGVTVDAAQNIYAIEDSATAATAGALVTFTAGTSGTATPSNTITGAATTLFFGGGLRRDSVGNLYLVNVVNPMTASFAVLGFGPTATGNVSPGLNFSSAAWNSAGADLALK